MSPVGTGDLEEMFLLAPLGRTNEKIACTQPQKAAQELIRCVLTAHIVKSEKRKPQLVTQAMQAERAKSKNKSNPCHQA